MWMKGIFTLVSFNFLIQLSSSAHEFWMRSRMPSNTVGWSEKISKTYINNLYSEDEVISKKKTEYADTQSVFAAEN